MVMKTRPSGPLKFKTNDREIVFARDAVKTAEIHKSVRYGHRPDFRSEDWVVKVNEMPVYRGKSESVARRKYERALKYI